VNIQTKISEHSVPFPQYVQEKGSSLHMLHIFMLNEKEEIPSVVSSLGIAMIDNKMKRNTHPKLTP